ncbi:hypothetical protein AURDEDRAFT_124692 [Auricularia subglabra TFB-10046 SS5]|nr:hypothetical protein AURDEDRAFT_124692 [Auricularia subglabra TFB-10046 SS5]
MASAGTLFQETAFREWAGRRLPALRRARSYDLLRGDVELRSYNELLNLLMEPFQCQIFDNHGQGSGVSSEQAYKLARRWLKNYTTPDHRQFPSDIYRTPEYSAPLERDCGRELWAATVEWDIRCIACQEMGISPSGPDSLLPYNFKFVRSNVIREEFSMLPEDVQEYWLSAGRERREVREKGPVTPATTQDFQETIKGWIKCALEQKSQSGAFGSFMAIHYSGFYVGEENRHLHLFHDQVSTFECEEWSGTQGERIFELWELGDDVGSHRFQSFHEDLKNFLEELFIRQSSMKGLESDFFWTEIDIRPEEFVDPLRLPRGIKFGHPSLLPDKEFRVLYEYIWTCRTKRDTYPSDVRFAFRPEALRDFPKLMAEKENRAVLKLSESLLVHANRFSSLSPQTSPVQERDDL